MGTPAIFQDQIKPRPCPCGKADWDVMNRISRGHLIKTVLFFLPLKRYKFSNCRKKVLIFDND